MKNRIQWIIQKTIDEWQQTKNKREHLEISDEEYLEWKINFEIDIQIK